MCLLRFAHLPLFIFSQTKVGERIELSVTDKFQAIISWWSVRWVDLKFVKERMNGCQTTFSGKVFIPYSSSLYLCFFSVCLASEWVEEWGVWWARNSSTDSHKISMSCWFVQRCVSVFVRNSSCLWFTFIIMWNSQAIRYALSLSQPVVLIFVPLEMRPSIVIIADVRT